MDSWNFFHNRFNVARQSKGDLLRKQICKQKSEIVLSQEVRWKASIKEKYTQNHKGTKY